MFIGATRMCEGSAWPWPQASAPPRALGKLPLGYSPRTSPLAVLGASRSTKVDPRTRPCLQLTLPSWAPELEDGRWDRQTDILGGGHQCPGPLCSVRPRPDQEWRTGHLQTPAGTGTGVEQWGLKVLEGSVGPGTRLHILTCFPAAGAAGAGPALGTPQRRQEWPRAPVSQPE